MVYDAYDRGISRNNSQDAAARVANEIFHHDLNQAAMETRGMLQNVSGRDAQAFVNRVDQDLAQLNRTYGSAPYGQYGENQVGNYLSARQTYDRYGHAVEHIDMVSGDRFHHRSVADVPIQPYGRVPMNFNQYQPGEGPPPPSYYANQTPYNGFQSPVGPQSSYDYASNNPNYYASSNPNYYNYGNSGYDYQQPVPVPVPMPVSYGYGGYYHRQVPYGYGGGYGYEGYSVNTSIAAGALIGGVLARAFRI